MDALPTIELDPPTISMTFGVNDSPLAGKDGTHVSISLPFCFIVFLNLVCEMACILQGWGRLGFGSKDIVKTLLSLNSSSSNAIAFLSMATSLIVCMCFSAFLEKLWTILENNCLMECVIAHYKYYFSLRFYFLRSILASQSCFPMTDFITVGYHQFFFDCFGKVLGRMGCWKTDWA